MATLEQLIGVRSQLAEQMGEYCRLVIAKLDGMPWYRAGQPLRASDVAIPARVLKEEVERVASHRPGRDEDAPDLSHDREPAYRRMDPELAVRGTDLRQTPHRNAVDTRARPRATGGDYRRARWRQDFPDQHHRHGSRAGGAAPTR